MISMNSSDKQIIKIHRKRLSCADNDSNFGNYKNIEEDWENLQNNSKAQQEKLMKKHYLDKSQKNSYKKNITKNVINKYNNIEKKTSNKESIYINKNNKLLTLNKNIKMICDQLYNTNTSKNLNNSILHNQSNHYNHISLTEGK